MNQFTFTSKQKTFLLSFMGLGVLCLALTFFLDEQPGHIRFWTNFLQNSVFFTGISFIILFFLSASITAWAGWYTVMKRLWESFTAFLVPGLGLMLIIVAGLWFDWYDIYHWSDPAEVAKDPILQGKSGFLNKNWYAIGTVVILGIWILFAYKLRQLSYDEDKNGTTDWNHHRKMRIWAAGFMPIAGFSSAALIWLWIMSVDSHWYSTLFAWYTGASWFVSAIALMLILLHFLRFKGYFQTVTGEHMHDLGKFLFAFSIFWTYLWFSQFMLIWYANVGEETIYFNTRMNEYPVLFFMNLGINFVLPFLVLMRNDTKRKAGTLIFVSIMVLIGHWIDFFLMIKPGALHTAQHAAHHGHHGEGHSEAGGHGAAHGAEQMAHATHGEDHADHGADHAGHGEDHGAEHADHADHGADHASHGEDHGTEHADHADHGADHASHGEEHGTEHADHADHAAHGADHADHAAHGADQLAADHADLAGHGAEHGVEHVAEAAEHAHEFLMGFSFPGLLEFGTMLGFLAFFVYVVFNQLQKQGLEPTNDPYLEESLHHHVGYGGGEIHHGEHH